MMIVAYFKYFLKARGAHSIHSPFVFDFYSHVLKKENWNKDFEAIEAVRRRLEGQKNETVQILDLGAGSKSGSATERTVAQIARKSLKSSYWGRLFYNMIRYYNCENILELGTSLGVTTAYLAKAGKSGIVYSLEGCPGFIEIARQNFTRLNLKNVLTSEGNIDITLYKTLQQIGWLDFAFFDANHRYEPTKRYFEICMKKVKPHSIFIFDDIHWSEEMEKAWDEIRNDERVRISIDLFEIGIVFFKEGVEKQHFVLR